MILLERMFNANNFEEFTLAEDLAAEVSVEDLAVPSFLASFTGPEAPADNVKG